MLHDRWSRDSTFLLDHGLPFAPQAEQKLSLLLQSFHDLVDVRADVFVVVLLLILRHQHVVAAVVVGDFTFNREDLVIQKLPLLHRISATV